MPLTIGSGNPTGTNEDSQDSAFKVGNPEIFNIPAPASLSGAANTLTATQVINGVVSEANGGSATTLTLPSARITATGLAPALRQFSSRGIIPGDSIYLYIINNGAGVMTIANNADGSITFDPGSPATVPANSSRTLLIRFTNGTPGSEAAVLF